VIHRTFRSLDEAPKLVGFTVKQWAALIAGSGLLLGVIHLAHVPTKPAITLCVFVVGLPAALTYVSESGGLQISVVLLAMWRWRWSTHTLAANTPDQGCRARGVLVFTDTEKRIDPPCGPPGEAQDDVPWERWG
jgi:hypothetical protein